MGTVCCMKQFNVNSACKNLKLKSSHDWKAKSSGWGPSREMSGVCWGSLTPLGDRSDWRGDKLVPSAPYGACFYLSEPALSLLGLRRPDLLVVIPKGSVFIVICAHVEALPRKCSLSTSHECFFWLLENDPFQVAQETEMCNAGGCGMGWCCFGPMVLLPIWARWWSDVIKCTKDFFLVMIIPCCTRHLNLLLQEGKAERDGEQKDCSFFLSPGGCVI